MEAPATSTTTYNVLHNEMDEGNPEQVDEIFEEEEEEEEHLHHHSHKHEAKKDALESFDFNDTESMMWRKVFQIVHIFSKFIDHSMIYCYSINLEDIIKVKESFGLLHVLRHSGNGPLLF
jgi:hypothetical protein